MEKANWNLGLGERKKVKTKTFHAHGTNQRDCIRFYLFACGVA